ncbi:MAG: hypothetical protein ABUS49_02645 [Acidobacteriota bacterium]
MKIFIAIIVLSAVAFAATADQAKKKKAPVKAKAAPAALVIPKDAVPNPDGTYAYTDKQGKKWLYKNSPFGVLRAPDAGVAADSTGGLKSQFVKATDAGDTVKFERPSPFGATKWEKKKTDLTDEERALLQDQAPQTKSEQHPE